MNRIEMFRTLFPETFPLDLASFYVWAKEEGEDWNNLGICLSKNGELCRKVFQSGDWQKIPIYKIIGSALGNFHISTEISFSEMCAELECLRLTMWLENNEIDWVITPATIKRATPKIVHAIIH